VRRKTDRAGRIVVGRITTTSSTKEPSLLGKLDNGRLAIREGNGCSVRPTFLKFVRLLSVSGVQTCQNEPKGKCKVLCFVGFVVPFSTRVGRICAHNEGRQFKSDPRNHGRLRGDPLSALLIYGYELRRISVMFTTLSAMGRFFC